MWTKQKRKSNINYFILPFLMLMIIIYFIYHIYNGRYGLDAQKTAQKNIVLLQEQLRDVTQKRIRLQKRIDHLKEGMIEKDMLDEYARRALNLSQKKELTILLLK